MICCAAQWNLFWANISVRVGKWAFHERIWTHTYLFGKFNQSLIFSLCCSDGFQHFN